MDAMRRRQIETLLAEQHTSWNAMKNLEIQADKIIPELLAEIDRLKAAHAEWALRATVYHEILLSEVTGVLDSEAIEAEVQSRMERALTMANNLAALSS